MHRYFIVVNNANVYINREYKYYMNLWTMYRLDMLLMYK